MRYVRTKLGYWGLALVAASALASTHAFADQAATEKRGTSNVSTWRSDGAIYPQVRQAGRQQKVRRVRVNSSVQAMPAAQTWQRSVEPPSGGNHVAPAGNSEVSTPSVQPVIILPTPLPAPKSRRTN